MTGRLIGTAAAALVALVLASASADAADIHVYSSLPLSGSLRPESEDIIRGERLALARAGGMAGPWSVEFISLDNAGRDGARWSRERTLANARTAGQDAKARLYLGEYDSFATELSIEVLNGAGILQISPTNVEVGLTRQEAAGRGEPDRHYPTGHRTYGRVVAADHLQAAALAALVQRRGLKPFVVEDGSRRGHALRRMLVRRLTERELDVVGVGRGSDGVPSLARRIARARATGVVYTGTNVGRGVELWHAVHGRRRRVRLIASSAMATPGFTGALRRGAARRTRITRFVRPVPVWGTEARGFAHAFQNRYGRRPGLYAILGYEAMSLGLDAIARSADADKWNVVDAFFSTSGRDSVLGRYSIDANGDTTLSTYAVWRIARGGGLVYDRTVDGARP